jgi:hypothetical protein
MQAAVAILRKQIESLQNRINSKQITIEIRMGYIEPESYFLNEMHVLSPTSISWSNICDYFHPSEFGNMLRASSQPYTRHTIYSMNW